MTEKEKIDENSVFEAILERENLGSTGYGDGVAFPHARIEGLDKVIAVFAGRHCFLLSFWLCLSFPCCRKYNSNCHLS